MNDLISRQAAIDALYKEIIKRRLLDDVNDGMLDEFDTEEILRKLPSAQPDLDEWCTDCKEYDQERHCCPRWNRVIRNALRDAQIDLKADYIEAGKMPEPRWIPVTERLPENSEEVLTTYIVNGNKNKRYTETATYFDGDDGFWSSPWDEYRVAGTRIDVIAWMPLPQPYERSEE